MITCRYVVYVGKGQGTRPSYPLPRSLVWYVYIYVLQQCQSKSVCCYEVGAVVHILCKATYCTCVSTLDPIKEIHILYNLFRYVNGDKPGFYFPCLPSYWTGSAWRQTTREVSSSAVQMLQCGHSAPYSPVHGGTCSLDLQPEHTNEQRGQRLTTC